MVAADAVLLQTRKSKVLTVVSSSTQQTDYLQYLGLVLHSLTSRNLNFNVSTLVLHLSAWIVWNSDAADHTLPRRRAEIFDARSAFNLGVSLNRFPGAAAPYQEPVGWNEFRPPIRHDVSSPLVGCDRTTWMWEGGCLILAAELHIHACSRKNAHTYIHSRLLCGDANPGISRFLWGCLDRKINLACDQYSYQVFLHPCSILNLYQTNLDSCKTSMHTLFFLVCTHRAFKWWCIKYMC